jgi:hypothetical protein
MSLPLPEFVDERFLNHRLRASSTAGITCAVLAIVATFLVVKYVLFFWYRRTD